MILRYGKKAIISIMLVLTLSVVCGGLIQTINHQNPIINIAVAADEDDSEADEGDSESSDSSSDYNSDEAEGDEKKDKKDKNTKKSYASYLFDKTDKNQSIMYFNSQTNAKVPTVESTINEKADKKMVLHMQPF